MQRFVVLVIILALMISACGGDSNGDENGDTASIPEPTIGAGTGNASSGELRMAVSFLPATLDPVQDAYSLIQRGAAETLTRVTPDQGIEPWLAESVTQVEEAIWEVFLRENATFWDGSPVTAEEVKASLERALEEQAAAARYLDVETEITVVDERTLRFELPEPIGSFMNALAASQFVIFKDGDDGPLMTGPYRPTRLATDSELELEAFAEHWSGPPPIARVLVRQMADANARSLALQSGEVDVITQVPSALVDGFPDDIETIISPSIRVHHLVLNHQREPFNDRAVREATNLAIDRSILNQIVLDGIGLEMSHMFSAEIGLPTPPEVAADVERAAEILDEAGWVAGSNGTREKDGVALAFTIYSYPGRPELTPMAISIQDQLGRLGYDIEVEQVDDVTALIEGGDFDASMWSLNMLPNGDPYYPLSSTIVEGADFNYGGYQNIDLQQVVEELRLTSDPAERERLILEAQEMMSADVVNVYLISPPQIAAVREGTIQNLTLHPNEMYLIDTRIAVQ